MTMTRLVQILLNSSASYCSFTVKKDCMVDAHSDYPPKYHVTLRVCWNRTISKYTHAHEHFQSSLKPKGFGSGFGGAIISITRKNFVRTYVFDAHATTFPSRVLLRPSQHQTTPSSAFLNSKSRGPISWAEKT
jgi:hypothetical protein